MGLFSPRPEEPTEWAGLPSEPLETRSPADRLAADGPIDALGLLTGSGVASIPLEVTPPERGAGDGSEDDAADA
ncbi:MAG TPA: hypothetical protein VFY91_10240 [Microbacterium sp.]|nr:hypothetical protein [Microbacterium sp.]